MNSKLVRISGIWERICSWLWIGLVFALPVSSFPVFAKLIHTSSVAPAAGIFVLLLTVFWFPVFLLRGGRFPFQGKPVILFTLYCVFTIALAFFRQVPFYPGSSTIANAVEALATLGMGFLFYLITTSFPNNSGLLRNTIKAINWGGMVMLGWSLLQIVLWLPGHDFPEWMRVLQRFFSTTVLFDKRTTGFASEPSWLAHMLNLVYLPYWLGATLKRFSAHKWRIWFLSVENILLGLGTVVLFLTFSRGGLVSFMLVIGFLFIRLNVQFVKWIIRKWHVNRKTLLAVNTGFIMFVMYLGIGVGGLFVLSKIDPRMETVFKFSATGDNSLVKYIDNLQFGERVAYWQTGWNLFNDYPLTGVGLNFSGAYFPKYLPPYAWQLTETRDLMFRTNNLLNIKNLWVRLLGETGIIGFALFTTILVVTLITGISLARRADKTNMVIGWMGIFMLIAFIGEGFSVDSLALPYYWFTMALTAAAWRWNQTSRSVSSDGQI
jgi:O-antigen ligase